jgi:hypothetical protein
VPLTSFLPEGEISYLLPLLPLCFLRDPVGRHALGGPPKSRWSARDPYQYNKEFLFGGVYPGTGGVSGKVEQKV